MCVEIQKNKTKQRTDSLHGAGVVQMRRKHFVWSVTISNKRDCVCVCVFLTMWHSVLKMMMINISSERLERQLQVRLDGGYVTVKGYRSAFPLLAVIKLVSFILWLFICIYLNFAIFYHVLCFFYPFILVPFSDFAGGMWCASFVFLHFTIIFLLLPANLYSIIISYFAGWFTCIWLSDLFSDAGALFNLTISWLHVTCQVCGFCLFVLSLDSHVTWVSGSFVHLSKHFVNSCSTRCLYE